jgi:SOS-response transcriptional repressor LexA
MSKPDTKALRLSRLREAVEEHFNGNRAAVGRALGYADGAFIRQMLTGVRPVTEKTMRQIEALPGLAGWFSDGPHAPSLRSSSFRSLVPVVGTTDTGPRRAFEEGVGYALRHGDRYVEVVTNDLQAYALRVAGDAMSPRLMEGEWIVVEPNTQPMPGDDVLLKTKDGNVLVQQIVCWHAENLILTSLSVAFKRMTRHSSDIDFMHVVGARLPVRAIRQRIDIPTFVASAVEA